MARPAWTPGPDGVDSKRSQDADGDETHVQRPLHLLDRAQRFLT